MNEQVLRIEYHLDSNGLEGDIDPLTTQEAFTEALRQNFPSASVDVHVHEKTHHSRKICPPSKVVFRGGTELTGDEAINHFKKAIQNVKPAYYE